MALGEQRQLAIHPEFSKLAIRIERGYKVMAWAVLTLFLFFSMASSFIQSFTEVVF